MRNSCDADGKARMLIVAYRSALVVILCLGLFSLSTSFILLSSSQVFFAQASSSQEMPLSQGTNQLAELESAKQQYLSVWNNTAFSSQFDVFIEEGSHGGYGIYREHVPESVFRPGETILLYVEPVGFGHQPVIDGDNVNNTTTLYRMNMTADYIISDSSGNELATIEDLQVGELISHSQNTEFSLTLTLSQEEPFPVGDYLVTYVVHDQVTGQSFQIDKRITIDDNVTTGSPVLPRDDESVRTIPSQQPQQQ